MMAATAIIKTIQPGPDDDMNILARLSGAKRTSDEQGDLEKATPSTKRIRTRHVSWADHRNEIHVQASNQKTFKDYKDEDIWYTVSPDFAEQHAQPPPYTQNHDHYCLSNNDRAGIMKTF